MVEAGIFHEFAGVSYQDIYAWNPSDEQSVDGCTIKELTAVLTIL